MNIDSAQAPPVRYGLDRVVDGDSSAIVKSWVLVRHDPHIHVRMTNMAEHVLHQPTMRPVCAALEKAIAMPTIVETDRALLCNSILMATFVIPAQILIESD